MRDAKGRFVSNKTASKPEVKVQEVQVLLVRNARGKFVSPSSKNNPLTNRDRNGKFGTLNKITIKKTLFRDSSGKFTFAK